MTSCILNIKLSGVQPNVLSAFMMSRSLFTEAIGKCIHNCFDDLQQEFFKAGCLLDTNLWPTDRDDLAAFGVADVSLAVEHFRRLLLKNNVLPDGVMTDWTFFKMYWIDKLRHHQKILYSHCFCPSTKRNFQTLCNWCAYCWCFQTAMP